MKGEKLLNNDQRRCLALSFSNSMVLPLLVKGEKLLNNDQRRCLAFFLYSLYSFPWEKLINEQWSKTMFSLIPLLTLCLSLSLWKGRSYSLMEWDKKIPVYWNIFSELASFPIIFTFCVMIIPFSPFKKPGFLEGLWCLVLQIVKYKAHSRPIIKISSSFYIVRLNFV